MNATKDHPAAYQAGTASVLYGDTQFYARIRKESESRTKVEEFEIPVRDGRAWAIASATWAASVISPSMKSSRSWYTGSIRPRSRRRLKPTTRFTP